MGDQELPMVEQVQLESDMNTYLVSLLKFKCIHYDYMFNIYIFVNEFQLMFLQIQM